MKLFVVGFLLVVLVAAAYARPNDDRYDSKYDNFDTQRLIDDPQLLKAYAICLLGEGSCEVDEQDTKVAFPEIMATGCVKCTPKQRQAVRTVVGALQKQVPELWDRLVKQHDPEAKYTESFDKFLAGSD